MWLELTGRCQLNCVHCYADSGPTKGHGTMTTQDWLRAIDEAADHGVGRVCMIGGEPTAHPAFAQLLRHALASGIDVEVFSNLFRMTDELWSLFSLPGVSLATSYYSDAALEHDAITGRRGSYARTRANIAEAIRRGIPIRIGIIGLSSEQRTEQARAELVTLGVPESAIGFDRLRAFGRGAAGPPNEADTCGHCGHGNAAIMPDGSVTPCVFTRSATAGSVRAAPLAELLTGSEFAAQVARLDALRHNPTGSATGGCVPDRTPRCGPDASRSPQVPPTQDDTHHQVITMPCVPNMCDPQCGPSCSPACNPTGTCRPAGGCTPDYR
jgi:MoaA/NifB/PqqE/SkfB family radical SAM enzyme